MCTLCDLSPAVTSMASEIGQQSHVKNGYMKGLKEEGELFWDFYFL